MRQARYSVEHPRVIFRETFNSEFDVRRNGGTPTDVTFSNGIGTFDGAASVVTYEREGLRQANPWSVRIRFKAGVTATGNLFSCGYNGTDRTGIAFDTGEIRCGTRTSSWLSRSTALTDTDSWHEVVAAHPGGNVRLSAYLDGVVMTGVNSPAGTPTEHFSIGAIFTPSNFFTGDISLVEIYNYQLSAEEVSNLYEGKRLTGIGVHGEQLGAVLNVSNCANSAGSGYDTFANETPTAFDAISLSGSEKRCGTADEIEFVDAQKYVITFDLALTSGTAPHLRFTNNLEEQGRRQAGSDYQSVIGSNVVEYTANITGTGVLSFIIVAVSNYQITNLSIKKVLVEQTSEILNVSAQSGSIIEKHTGDEISLVPDTWDWPDDNSDGVPNDWTEISSGKATSSIITGNGFIGNALRYEWTAADEVATAVLSYPVDIPSGWDVHLRVKYRTSGGVRFFTDGGSLQTIYNVSGDHTGNATTLDATITTADAKTTIKIYIGTNNINVTGRYFEIDELVITKIRPEVVNTATTVAKEGEVRAMLFDGSTSKIDCGDPDGVGMIGNRTFHLWFKAYGYGEIGLGTLLTNGGPSLAVDNKLILYQNSGNPTTMGLRSNTGTSTSTGADAYVLNKWTCLTITRTSTGTTNFYINGMTIGSADQAGGTPAAGTTNLFIGNTSTGDRAYDGLMNDIRIYSGLLSAAKISQLFSNERKKYGI